jgi:hypothetical protein
MEAIPNKWIVKERKPAKEPVKEEAKADKPLHSPVYKASRIRTLSGVRK